MIRKANQLWKSLKFVMNQSERIVGMNSRNLSLIYPNNQRRDYPLADNKLLTKQWLGKHQLPTTRLIATIDHFTQIESTISTLNTSEEYVIKPAEGSGGKGILLAFKNTLGNQTWSHSNGSLMTQESLKNHVAQILKGQFSLEAQSEVALIESLVRPTKEFLPKLNQLCDLRIISLQNTVIAGMLRVPTKHSNGKANLHQGGIGLGVNLLNGFTHFATQLGKNITQHPDTLEPLEGIAIPDWQFILEESTRLSELCPLKYLGIDWALSQDGPKILEINTRPGLEIQNANQEGLHQLIKEAQ